MRNNGERIMEEEWRENNGRKDGDRINRGRTEGE